MTTATAPRIPRCRYLRANGDQCQNEAVDPLEDTVLCAKHLMRAHHVWLRHYRAAMAKAR